MLLNEIKIHLCETNEFQEKSFVNTLHKQYYLRDMVLGSNPETINADSIAEVNAFLVKNYPKLFTRN